MYTHLPILMYTHTLTNPPYTYTRNLTYTHTNPHTHTPPYTPAHTPILQYNIDPVQTFQHEMSCHSPRDVDMEPGVVCHGRGMRPSTPALRVVLLLLLM